MDFQQAKSFFANQKQPVSLYQNIWFENTTVLFHSPRFYDVNKSDTAISIANDVAAKGRDVLYISTEALLGKVRVDAERLFIFTPEFESIDDKRDYADLVFEAIEHAVRNTDIRTFVIDSVTRIAALSFGRNASAAYIMKRLVAMQVKCKLSLLVLADDTTRSTVRALISLATAEIAPSNETREGVTPNSALDAAGKEIVYTPMPYPPFPVCRPAAEPVLTRQQRRALARQHAANR